MVYQRVCIRSYILLLATFLFLLLGLGCSHAVKSKELREKATLVSIVDGDTVHVTVSGEVEKIRLIGIDTPESRYSKKALRDARRSGNDLKTIYEMGNKSTEYLRTMISPGDPVFLEFDVERREKNGSRTFIGKT